MADTGIVNAASAQTIANFAGDIAWSNPNNVTTSDDTRATASLSTGAASRFSETLASEFGGGLLGIPSSAIILGIECFVEWGRVSGSGQPEDYEARLYRAGAAVGDDKGTHTTQTSEIVQTYGGASDLWGTAWTPADFAGTMGLIFIARNASGSFSCVVGVDCVQMRITYKTMGIVYRTSRLGALMQH